MDQNMTDRRDQRRESHDKGACPYSRFEFHPKKNGKYHQHHHAAARSHKTGAETYGKTEEQGDRDAFPIQLFTFCRLFFAAGIRLYKESDTDEKRQKQRETSEYYVSCQKSDITPDCAHCKDTDQHDPAALQVDIFILCISISRDS